jgi:hypothetical protein
MPRRLKSAIRRYVGLCAAGALAALLAAETVTVEPAAAAQAQADTTAASEQVVGTTAGDQQQTYQQSTPPPPPKPSYQGPFAKGRKRVGLYAGAGSTYSSTYLILGIGGGYFVANGLELGVDFDAWLLQSPQFYRLTPQVRYVFWQMNRFMPYAGAFYRWSWASDDYPDRNSWGGRAGLAYRSGRGFAAVGVVYEKFTDSAAVGDSDTWYPEIAFWLFF